jgi:hypothetical protein
LLTVDILEHVLRNKKTPERSARAFHKATAAPPRGIVADLTPKERHVGRGRGVLKVDGPRVRTGSLEPHFFTQNSQNYFFMYRAPQVGGVAKSLGHFALGPVILLHTQKLGIKYKKPFAKISFVSTGP